MSSRSHRLAIGVFAIGLAAAVADGCRRDARTVEHEVPPGGSRAGGVRQGPLRPGWPVSAEPARANPVAGDPAALRDGERLYNWMNCVGCHFEGGGGIGPALIDDKWVYGSEPAQIFDSIVNGRPNGMPAFGDKLAAGDIWRIVAFVESLGERAEQAEAQSGRAADGDRGGN